MTEPLGEGSPYFLDINDTITLYAILFGCTEQQAADQIRNRSGLESALARPQAYVHYQQADIALQAAALAHGIAEGQHFIEGNKRLALVTMRTFLRLNGEDLTADQETLFEWIVGLSAGATVEQLAASIRAALRS